jgi:hypothetical protein
VPRGSAPIEKPDQPANRSTVFMLSSNEAVSPARHACVLGGIPSSCWCAALHGALADGWGVGKVG